MVALHGVVLTNGQGDHLKTLQCIVIMFGDDNGGDDDMIKSITVYEIHIALLRSKSCGEGVAKYLYLSI